MKKGISIVRILVIFILIVLSVISYRALERRIDLNRKTSFHKCMNIGNALEAPKDIQDKINAMRYKL